MKRRSRAPVLSILTVVLLAPILHSTHSFAQPLPEGINVYPNAAVAADHALASQAGLEMLQLGGNAVDAAVAASFALSVTRPYSCGVGGGGFMVIRLAPKNGQPAIVTAINYRETSPAAVDGKYFERDENNDPRAATHGGKAVAIPGHVAGMLYALEKYGTLDRRTVLAPAIRFARQGFNADAHYIESTQKDNDVIPWLKADAKRRDRFNWLWERCLKKGEIAIGDHVAMTEQADLFELIAAHGAAGFYEGPVADAIVRAVHADGGALTLEDLRGYRVQELPPLISQFQGRTVIGMPPPSSGGIVLSQVFEMLEDRPQDLEAAVHAGHNSALYVHLVTEASKHGFADRARWLGDTNFVDVPLKSLLSPQYIRSRANAINLQGVLPHDAYGSTTPFPPDAPPKDDHGTSHLCVIDKDGNAVACTETINLIYGSLLAVPEYGFVLNDTMDDFLTRAGHANAFGLSHADRNRPQPGKRPLSSMTPTIVVGREGTVDLIAGGAGGPRIISGTVQASLNVLLFNLSAIDAVSRPRFHHQWEPERLDLEPALRGGELEAALQALGHNTAARKSVANVQIIRRVPNGWQPACDPRKGGSPAGY
jgi:gamma-glutamyltranspeptidase / glutathione hydrolase